MLGAACRPGPASLVTGNPVPSIRSSAAVASVNCPALVRRVASSSSAGREKFIVITFCVGPGLASQFGTGLASVSIKECAGRQARSDVAATCFVAASMCSVGERCFDLGTPLQGAQDGDLGNT